MSKEALIQAGTADQADAPAYFTYDAVRNSEERPTLDEVLAREMNPLTLDAVLALQADGAQILDTCDPDEFVAVHISGSINIGLGGQYATGPELFSIEHILSHSSPMMGGNGNRPSGSVLSDTTMSLDICSTGCTA